MPYLVSLSDMAQDARLAVLGALNGIDGRIRGQEVYLLDRRRGGLFTVRELAWVVGVTQIYAVQYSPPIRISVILILIPAPAV
jgi:hypothetical protein